MTSSMDAFESFSSELAPRVGGGDLRYFTGKARENRNGPLGRLYLDLRAYCLRKSKRVRGLLLMLGYLGYEKGGPRLPPAIRIAAVLEIMHSSLLVHDDIIDRSDTRRGGKSLHVLLQDRLKGRFRSCDIGTDLAIILGDLLFFNSTDIIAGTDLPADRKNELLSIFGRTYELTVKGQVLDSLNALTGKVPPKGIAHEISTLKTAFYTIYGPLAMGYVLAGSPNGGKELATIERFSMKLGLAFQVRDDLLGVFGDEARTGKSTLSDLMEGKYSILVHHAVRNLGRSKGGKFLKKLSSGGKSAADCRALKRELRASGAIGSTIAELNGLVTAAGGSLTALNLDDRRRSVLSGLVERIGRVEWV